MIPALSTRTLGLAAVGVWVLLLAPRASAQIGTGINPNAKANSTTAGKQSGNRTEEKPPPTRVFVPIPRRPEIRSVPGPVEGRSSVWILARRREGSNADESSSDGRHLDSDVPFAVRRRRGESSA